VYNIQKAVGRLDFAPKQSEIQVTDIKKGLGEFVPKPERPVSFNSIFQNLKKAGYTLADATITVDGKLSQDGDNWFIIADISGQKFQLEGASLPTLIASKGSGVSVEITGGWRTVGTAPNAVETIDVKTATALNISYLRPMFRGPSNVELFETPFENASPIESSGKRLAPIRTTSPGLTVYKGGAITPRFYLVKQHLNGLDVWRQQFDLSLSYTPATKLQLEAEVSASRTSYDDGTNDGSGAGLGNIKLWAKYRFFRKVKTWGDRQAAARFGVELPTGSKASPTASQVNAPAFVRAQLGSISGGFSPHFDVAFSQAGGRWIFGGNVEGILRTERDGFRLGHELRANTDLEYVLFPRDYQKPGHELFLIFETTTIYRSHGRLNDMSVPGSTSTEFFVTPGLQYTVRPNFVIEGNIQLPVIRNTGPLIMKTDFNLLLGMRYLF
jgi:hypothetical protein